MKSNLKMMFKKNKTELKTALHPYGAMTASRIKESVGT